MIYKKKFKAVFLTNLKIKNYIFADNIDIL